MNPILNLLVARGIASNGYFAMAEVGTWSGESVAGYVELLRASRSMIYLIDWFRGNPTADGLHSYVDTKREDVKAKLLTVVADLRYMLMDGPSAEMIPLLPDAGLDLAFIDADHRYSNVKQDIELMLPKMKSGGTLCGHDYENPDPVLIDSMSDEELERDMARGVHAGVAKAVREIFGDKVFAYPDSMWVVRV